MELQSGVSQLGVTYITLIRAEPGGVLGWIAVRPEVRLKNDLGVTGQLKVQAESGWSSGSPDLVGTDCNMVIRHDTNLPRPNLVAWPLLESPHQYRVRKAILTTCMRHQRVVHGLISSDVKATQLMARPTSSLGLAQRLRHVTTTALTSWMWIIAVPCPRIDCAFMVQICSIFYGDLNYELCMSPSDSDTGMRAHLTGAINDRLPSELPNSYGVVCQCQRTSRTSGSQRTPGTSLDEITWCGRARGANITPLPPYLLVLLEAGTPGTRRYYTELSSVATT
ncbi:hypothetical protein C8Q79DRAFT_924280 [Trametes meyenii]|nr:hypothetical protein C8Q79DRAFT_924280 [Trametes meyenii]